MSKMRIKSIILSTLFATTVLAQTSQVTSTRVEESTDKYKVETNYFLNNWFVGGGLGGQVYFGKNDGEQSFFKRITPSYNLNVGKWFTPGIALRFGINGSNAKALTPNNSNWYEQFYNTGEIYKKEKNGTTLTYYKQEIAYTHLSAEALLNVTNLLYGYKYDRLYNVIPYTGFGWYTSKSKGAREDELSIVAGVLNTFRLNDVLDLTLDLKGTLTNAHFSHKKNLNVNEPGSIDKVLSASIGLIYKFGKYNWDKRKTITNTITVKYSDEELNRLLKEKADALAKEKADALARAKEKDALTKEKDALARLNDSLKQALNNRTSTVKVKTERIIEKSLLAPPLLVTFPIGKTTLSREARVNLGYFAKITKKKPDVIYTITGYADKSTGTSEINERLSRERSQVVYNTLIREFGVNPSQLRPAHQGGVENLFYDDPKLSRAVIAFEVEK